MGGHDDVGRQFQTSVSCTLCRARFVNWNTLECIQLTVEKSDRSVRPFFATMGKQSSFRWFVGMICAALFSGVYFVAPFYMVTSLLALLFRFPSLPWAALYSSPLLVSALIPSLTLPSVVLLLKPMLDYFEFEEIIEESPVDVVHEIRQGRNYLCVCQPHGALSFTGIACAVNSSRPDFLGKVPTAVADAVLYTPIIKHVMGIFGLISASKRSMQKRLRKKGLEGTIVLYVGGLAEMFLSSETEERLFLKNRKGFIKLALSEGVDVVPIYLFGNTSVLSVLKTGFLASVSRKVSHLQRTSRMPFALTVNSCKSP